MDTQDHESEKEQVAQSDSLQMKIPTFTELLSECENLRAEVKRLRCENETLIQENSRLKNGSNHKTVSQIAQPELSTEVDPPDENNCLGDLSTFQATENPTNVHEAKRALTNADKVKIFRRLFRGREDVYAERWQTKDGASMYSPKKEHQWNKHTRNEKGKSICVPECKLQPMTDDVARDHLAGNKVIGVYPLLLDETCWFLAVDFDEEEWEEDALAFLLTCDKHMVPAYLERSRSGTGAHVWVFFDRPLRASLARSLGTFLLSETKRERYQIGFKSYDRMFPNQDTMPRGGYGNLIALPLQAGPRKSGNSIFVDRNLEPIADQWNYLNNVQHMRQRDIETIVREAASREAIVTVPLSSDDLDSDEPWNRKTTAEDNPNILPAPFPKEASIVQSNMIFLAKDGFGSAALSKIMELAAFQNPEFYQKQATRQSTHDTPRIICCAEILPKHIALPRGCLESLEKLFSENQIDLRQQDKRHEGTKIQTQFKGQLREDQTTAAAQMLSNDIGILCGSTAFGKTVVAINMIAQRQTNTLILVNSLALVEQWKERLLQFLDISPKSIGQIGGGKKKRTGVIDIATIQSLVRKGVVSDAVSDYGQIIIDECHHISAFSFEQCAKESKAKFVVGLTATPNRKDGHHPIINMQCGPIRFKDARGNRKVILGVKHEVISRETGFQLDASIYNGPEFHEIYKALANDSVRNELIFDDILKELDQGRSPLVITERVEHLLLMAAKLEGFAKNIIVLQGGMSKKERTEVFSKLKSIPQTSERIILATGKYIGEGFDDARLDTLFLLLPISFGGKVEQYAGRLHREHEEKTSVRIYDYVDSGHPMLRKMFEKRRAKYKKLGYEIVVS